LSLGTATRASGHAAIFPGRYDPGLIIHQAMAKAWQARLAPGRCAEPDRTPDRTGNSNMTGPLITALREARAALEGAVTVEPGEAAMTRRLTRELDDAIARIEGSELDSDLTSIVCHDLKDPLASIVMGAGYLRKTIPPEESATRRVVDAILRSADRMNQVVSDFHDLAKLEAGLLPFEPQPCDVAATVRGAMTPFEVQARERGITLTLEGPGERLVASCDRSRMAQIASKLIGNALKFTPPAGRVVVNVTKEDDRVRISVSDTGRGIPPERIPVIFDRAANARRSPRDGPGLGLAIARGLVELCRGEITAESRVGEGSTFAFTVPLVRV
jgi:chemotaxis family two-component system sensor kinase Cph1